MPGLRHHDVQLSHAGGGIGGLGQDAGGRSREVSDIKSLAEELKRAQLNLKAVLHEDGGVYSRTKWTVDECKVKLFDALTASIPLDRLREICAAERDGRCAVLRPAQQPSKDGKEKPSCFYTDKPRREYCMAYCHSRWDDEPIDACKECWFCDGNDDFRESAEAALKGGTA
jgi:hypothetical protein